MRTHEPAPSPIHRVHSYRQDDVGFCARRVSPLARRTRDRTGADDTGWHSMGRGEQHFGVPGRSVAKFALEIALEVALQDSAQQEALTGVRASDQHFRAVSMVAGVGFEPTTFGL